MNRFKFFLGHNGLGLLLSIPGLLFGWAPTAWAQDRLTPYRAELEREGVLRDVTVDGRRYTVADQGRGPAIVLLHGLGGSIYDWRHLMKPLAENRRVIAIDLLGAGESDRPEEEDYSITAQARRVRGVLDAIRCDRAVLVGNSYGGGVALKFAQDWPDRVERLVLIDSICYRDQLPGYVSFARIPWAGCIAETLPVRCIARKLLRGRSATIDILSDEELEGYAAELSTPGRRAAMVETLRAAVPPDTKEFEARLREIRVPALVIWGAKDGTIPVELGRRLAKDLPDARFVELDAGHVPNQECPDLVLKHLREFLP